jgi:hypothetical protein
MDEAQNVDSTWTLDLLSESPQMSRHVGPAGYEADVPCCIFSYLPALCRPSISAPGPCVSDGEFDGGSFFVPYSSTRVWEPGQLVLAVLGIGCFVYLCMMFRRSLVVTIWGSQNGADKTSSKQEFKFD